MPRPSSSPRSTSSCRTDELDRFVTWLKINSSWVLEETKRHSGALTAEWLDRAKRAIDDGDCRRLHVPRYLFGLYLTEQIEAKAEQAAPRAPPS